MESKIKRAYLNYKLPGSFSGQSGFTSSGKRTESKRVIDRVLKSIPTFTTHHYKQRPAIRRFVYVPYINAQWGVDLRDISRYARQNNNNTFILVAIDMFSKRAWMEPLKNKSGIAVRNGFEKIFRRSNGIPETIQSDMGKEIYNKDVKELFDKLNIKLFSTQSELKCCVVERLHRTIFEKIHRYMTHNKTFKFVDKLRDFENLYNSSYHRSIGCMPKEVCEKNQIEVHNKLYGKKIGLVDKRKEKFKIGDVVLVSAIKKTFEKGATANWRPEKYFVQEIKQTYPRTYILRNQDNEIVQGYFYREELLKINH